MGALDLLADLADAGIVVEADADRLVIRPASRLTDELRAALRAAKPELLTLLAPAESRPYRLPKADADAARFVARVGLFLRRGIDAAAADDLAEAMHLRDVQAGAWAWCVECAHLAGRPGAWCCGNHRLAGMPRELAAAIVMRSQTCPAFSEVTS